MRYYVAKRLLTGFMVVMIVIVLTFLLVHIAPGDPIRILAGKDNPSPEMIKALQQKYGLDKPIYIQLISYMKNLAKGDLGTSILHNQPVSKMIMDRMGPTILLALTGAVLAVVLGTLLGLYAARYNGTKIDAVLSYISYFFYSMPSFWLGLMLILIFASWLKILPTSGMVNLRAPSKSIGYVLDVLKHLVLPVLTLTLIQIPIYFKIFKSSIMQVMTEDFVTTFKATGMD